VTASPVFLRDPARGALLAFPSAEAAAAHLRPWQEVGGVAAWDAEGRLVTFTVRRERRRLLGLLPVWREEVRIASVEELPEHAGELRSVLLAALGEAPGERAAPGTPLADLVRRAAARCPGAGAGPPFWAGRTRP
jgi:hypothetical protein